jgi:tetratricopeptide (TPR) repeat protein
LKEAEDLFRRSLKIREELAAADPENPSRQGDLTPPCNFLGDVLLQLGQLEQSLSYYERALQIRQELAANAGLEDSEVQVRLAASHMLLGNYHFEQGDLPKAQQHFQQAFEVHQRLAGAAPDDDGGQRRLALSSSQLGRVLQTAGRPDEARSSFEQCYKIRQALLRDAPGNTLRQKELADACQFAQEIAADPKEAMSYAQEGHALRRALAEAQPQKLGAQMDFARSLGLLGDAQLKAGQQEESLKSFVEAADVTRKLSAEHPQALNVLRMHWKVCSRLTDVALEMGGAKQALAFTQETLEIAKKLAAATPPGALERRYVVSSYGDLGRTLLQLERDEEGLAALEQALAAAQENAESHPETWGFQHDLFLSRYNLAQGDLAAENYAVAIEGYRGAKQTLEGLLKQDRNLAELRQRLEAVQFNLQYAQAASLAFGEWDQLVQQPQELLPRLLIMRGVKATERSDYAEAARTARAVQENEHSDLSHLYNAACLLCRCAASLQASDGQPLSPEQASQRQAWIDAALASLKKSVAAGFEDFEQMRKDEDLAPLRDLPEFKAMFSAP